MLTMDRVKFWVLIFLACTALCFAAGYSALADASDDSVQLPVIMYHSILKEGHGEYIINPVEFEADLKWLSENGWHTIGADELIRYVHNGSDLPEKPVMLTFDDGYYNNLLYAHPLLEKYGMKAVVSVIGVHADIWSENPAHSERYGHLSWSELKTMAESGVWEIANHSYNLHESSGGRYGCLIKNGEDAAVYRELFLADLEKIREKLLTETGVHAECFTYPFGADCAESRKALESWEFVKLALTRNDGQVNRIVRGEPSCLYDIRRMNRSSGKSVSAWLSDINC